MDTNRKELAGRVALVTGASRGIGRAAAIALAKAGADVALNYLSRDSAAREVQSLVEEHGRRCMLARGNVADASDVQGIVEQIVQTLGSITILVNNAGIAPSRKVEEITEADWDEVIDVNLKSVFLVTQAVLPGMLRQGWGRIINLSSAAVQLGGIIGPHYTASKAGVIGLTNSYAALLCKKGITVNAIAPGLIETEMIEGHPLARADTIPVRRFGTTDEVADVVLMLARNGYMTGQTINVNGGLCMS